MSKQHTPWRKLRKNAFTYTIVDKEGNYIFEVPASKDIHNTIVKAANNHDRLVEALEWAAECIRLPYELNHLAPSNEEKYLELKQLLTELKV